MASIGPASPETAARFRKRAAAQHDNKISAAAVARLKEEITEEKLLQRVEDRKAEREKAQLEQSSHCTEKENKRRVKRDWNLLEDDDDAVEARKVDEQHMKTEKNFI